MPNGAGMTESTRLWACFINVHHVWCKIDTRHVWCVTSNVRARLLPIVCWFWNMVVRFDAVCHVSLSHTFKFSGFWSTNCTYRFPLSSSSFINWASKSNRQSARTWRCHSPTQRMETPSNTRFFMYPTSFQRLWIITRTLIVQNPELENAKIQLYCLIEEQFHFQNSRSH